MFTFNKLKNQVKNPQFLGTEIIKKEIVESDFLKGLTFNQLKEFLKYNQNRLGNFEQHEG